MADYYQMSIILFALLLTGILIRDRKNVERNGIMIMRRTERGVKIIDKIDDDQCPTVTRSKAFYTDPSREETSTEVAKSRISLGFLRQQRCRVLAVRFIWQVRRLRVL